MTTEKQYADVTKENALTAEYFYHKTLRNKSDKMPLRAHRNGKTQVWKTRPSEFKVPVKYGLYEYFYITQYNCHEWQVEN